MVEFFIMDGAQNLIREHDAALASVRPRAKAEGALVRLATHDDRVDRVVEQLVSVVLPRAFHGREPIDTSVFAGNETVQTGRDINRALHGVHSSGEVVTASR